MQIVFIIFNILVTPPSRKTLFHHGWIQIKSNFFGRKYGLTFCFSFLLYINTTTGYWFWNIGKIIDQNSVFSKIRYFRSHCVCGRNGCSVNEWLLDWKAGVHCSVLVHIWMWSLCTGLCSCSCSRVKMPIQGRERKAFQLG